MGREVLRTLLAICTGVWAILKRALVFYNLHLKIAKEVGDKHRKGGAHGNLGNVNRSLGDYKKALEYFNPNLKIAKEVGDKHGKGGAYGNLSNVYRTLGDLIKVNISYNLMLKIAIESEDKSLEAMACYLLPRMRFSVAEWTAQSRRISRSLHNLIQFL